LTPSTTPGLQLVKSASPTIAQPYQPVTYTYLVKNTGGTSFDKADIVLVDDNGTPNYAGDDFKPTYVSGDNGNMMLDPLEVWTYSATVIPPVILQATNTTTGQPIPAGAVIVTEDVGNAYKVTYLQDFGINDNTYGTGSVGW